MRRLLWVLGVTLAGFFIGGKSDGLRGAILASLWGAGIGLGFAAVFNQKTVTKRIVAYWGISLALLGPIIALLVGAALLPGTSPVSPRTIAVAGAVVGLLVGLLIGSLQFKRLRRAEGDVASGT